MPDYDLFVESNALIAVFKTMGLSVTWLEQMRAPTEKRDYNKLCKFHNDHGHRTKDCASFHYEVVSLFKKGRLRDFLTEKGKQALEKGEQNKNQESKAIEILGEPPNVERIIGVIHGGSEVSGLIQTATKRHARELNSINSTIVHLVPISQDYELSFTHRDMQWLVDQHNDALVITLQIAN